MKLRYYQDAAVRSLFDFFGTAPAGTHPVIAMPTGTGKSVVIAEFIRQVFAYWPRQRVIMATHVKELVKQNASKMLDVWPEAPLGICSAGLNQRDTAMPIVFGSIGTLKNAIRELGFRDLVIVDEAHLVSSNDQTNYQKFIAALTEINPNLRVIGLSATPYRAGQGMITDGGLFTHICYDDTTMARFNQLIVEGYLAPLIPRPTHTQLDVSAVGMSNGEYNLGQLQTAVDKEGVTRLALQETMHYGQNRQSWLVFASGIEHAEHIAEFLQEYGIGAAAVHSKLPNGERDKRLAAFKAGELQAMATNNIATTGFDHPPVDLIAMLRPTMSVSLWVQMLGRGTRPSPDTQKENCLVLDFAKNTPRLGPINDPIKPRKKGEGSGDAPIRICDDCGAYNHASARQCCQCGEVFEFAVKIIKTAGHQELIRNDLPQFEDFDVNGVYYSRHEKPGNPASLQIIYQCGLRSFREWKSFESKGPALHFAHEWWKQRSALPVPATVTEALDHRGELRTPKRIKVWINKQYPEVRSYEF